MFDENRESLQFKVNEDGLIISDDEVKSHVHVATSSMII